MFVVALFLWQTTFELTRIDIEGLQRFDAAAVLQTAGLKTGARAGAEEFNGACRRVTEIGLFESCNWKYVPTTRTGVILALQLKEAEAGQKVKLTVPGVDDKQLWEWLRVNEPLVQPAMPGSDAAIQFYTQAIQRFLKKEVVSSVHSDLQTGENTFVFRPANLPRIVSVNFTGASAIAPAILEKTLTPLAKGTPFTEYDVRQLLDLNIRPLYENLGRLQVSFPSITAQDGAVSVQVDEGRVYTLAGANATGAPEGFALNLPLGKPAEWNKIAIGLESAAKALRDEGYLEARYRVERRFNEAAGAVNLAVTYTPGPRFMFGALRLHGLNVPQETNLRKLWTLPAGSPMKESYIEEFLRAALGKLGPEYSSVSHQLDPAGKNAVDVVITFGRK